MFATQTLHDSQQNNDDEEEEADVIEHPGIFQIISIRAFQFVTNTTASTNTRIEMLKTGLIMDTNET